MTDEPAAGPVLYWGHGVLQRHCAHIRRTRDGRPAAEDVDGNPVGFALCGCLLIADIEADAEGVVHCSVCLDLHVEHGTTELPD